MDLGLVGFEIMSLKASVIIYCNTHSAVKTIPTLKENYFISQSPANTNIEECTQLTSF